jgi:putative transposase
LDRPLKPRFNIPGIPQHVIQRANNREPCFFSEDDYYRCLDDLTVSAEKYQCKIHAYVLMTNHDHLLITPMVSDGIPQIIQVLERR